MRGVVFAFALAAPSLFCRPLPLVHDGAAIRCPRGHERFCGELLSALVARRRQ